MYACEVLGVTKRKVTYCKQTGKGFSNDSFCIVVEDQKAYHVRLAKNNFAINRFLEKSIMEKVGFVFVDFDTKSGDYVRHWLNGATPRAWNEILLRNVVKTLKVLHGTEPLPKTPSFNPHYYDQWKSLPKVYAQKYEQLLEKHSDQKDFCLCHNDVHSANLVLQEENRLVLIDYEWACLNSPLWELGNFVREERLSSVQVGVLLNEHGQGITLAKFNDYVFMASCYGWLWARCMPMSKKILRQRLRTSRDLKESYKSLSLIF